MNERRNDHVTAAGYALLAGFFFGRAIRATVVATDPVEPREGLPHLQEALEWRCEGRSESAVLGEILRCSLRQGHSGRHEHYVQWQWDVKR